MQPQGVLYLFSVISRPLSINHFPMIYPSYATFIDRLTEDLIGYPIDLP